MRAVLLALDAARPTGFEVMVGDAAPDWIVDPISAEVFVYSRRGSELRLNSTLDTSGGAIIETPFAVSLSLPTAGG